MGYSTVCMYVCMVSVLWSAVWYIYGLSLLSEYTCMGVVWACNGRVLECIGAALVMEIQLLRYFRAMPPPTAYQVSTIGIP